MNHSFRKVRFLLKRDIVLFLATKKNVVANCKLTALFERNTEDDQEEKIVMAFRPSSKRFELGTIDEIELHLDAVLATLRERIADFIKLDS